jgi:hypothetical protein
VAVQVDLSELSEHIASCQSKHLKDGVLQLQLLVSWLGRIFSGVSFHLGVNIDKAGLPAAISQPWNDAVEPLQLALLKCGTIHLPTPLLLIEVQYDSS